MSIDRSKVGKELIIGLAILLIVIGAFWLGVSVSDSELAQDLVQRFGYWGAFVAAVISGFNLIVPIPVTAFMPTFLAAGLNPWLVILLVTLGITTADLLAFYIGRAGRFLATPNLEKRIARLEELQHRHAWGPFVALLLYAAFIPYPNEILALPLGFLRYRVRYLVTALLIGNGIFVSLSTAAFVGLFNFLLR